MNTDLINKRLIWHVVRLWNLVGSSHEISQANCADEGLTLETSAKHHIPQAKNISQGLIKPVLRLNKIDAGQNKRVTTYQKARIESMRCRYV